LGERGFGVDQHVAGGRFGRHRQLCGRNPGWKITRQGQGSATLSNSDQTAELFATAGRADTPDIGQESSMLINQVIQGGGLTNVEQTLTPVESVQGKNFQKILEVDYTANIQSNQGTGQLYGGWVTYYNASTGMSGFLDFYAPTQALFKAALPDAAQMMVSME
jgi:hypothetical protein